MRRRTLGTLVFLAVQFLVGMAINLFASIPDNHPGAAAGDYFSGAFASVVWTFSSGIAVLITHVVIGFLLLFNAIELIVRARRSGLRGATWLASLGLFGILVSGLNGASFLTFHQDFSSMLMSTGFAISLVAYGALAAVT
jgi:hypothetical protein